MSIQGTSFWSRLSPCGGLFVIVIYLYLSVPSRIMLGDVSAIEAVSFWHPAYFGWYDVMLLAVGSVTLLISGYSLGGKTPIALTVVLACILLSFLSVPVRFAPLADAVLNWCRFSLVFVFAANMVLRDGVRAGTDTGIRMGILLMVGALLVFSLQYGVTNRIYSSAMTIGSFGVTMLVICWISLIEKRLIIAVLSSGFLILTFSRTSIVLWILSLVVYLLSGRTVDRVWKTVILGTILGLVAVESYFLAKNYEFAHVITDRADMQQIRTLSSRIPIWEYGNDLLQAQEIPISGVGFHNTTWLLMQATDTLNMGNSDEPIPTFHSVLYEYVIGMGIFSFPIFALIAFRIWTGLRCRAVLGTGIYVLFFISQSIDFTFYHPKEILLWGFFLGTAEGELQSRARERLRQLLSTCTTGPGHSFVEEGPISSGSSAI